MIRVAVLGALGKMGRDVVRAVLEDPDLELAALVDAAAAQLQAPHEQVGHGMLVLRDVALVDTNDVDVMVDFTVSEAAVRNTHWALDNGVHAVVGTSAIPERDLERFKEKADAGKANVLIAPNFAIGAVLMMRFAVMAASVFDQCEIIELHHRGKKDAPSGTALATARMVENAMNPSKVPHSIENKVAGARGGALGPVRIHSVRLDGLVAHQQVIFGGMGQTLSIRHDTTDRSCFMPGVVMAVKSIAEHPGLTIGLDNFL